MVVTAGGSAAAFGATGGLGAGSLVTGVASTTTSGTTEAGTTEAGTIDARGGTMSAAVGVVASGTAGTLFLATLALGSDGLTVDCGGVATGRS